ncbi:MAG: 2-phospho-L-lactate guanylyltransferase [Actinomycetota bacterium]
MKLCLIPMKPLARAKERLGVVLSADDRRRLALAMLADVVTAAKGFDAVWVVCSDDDAANTATDAGATPVPDRTPEVGLNESLAATTSEAIEAGATGMLIVSSDCPGATSEELARLALGDGVTLATDRARRGTNALWRQKPDVIPTYFGPESRRAHQGTCYGYQIPFALIPCEGLAIDVDEPADLELVAPIAGAATRGVLSELGYPQHRR